MGTGNMHKKFGKDHLCSFQVMQAHRQTNRHTITIPHTPTSAVK